MHDDAETRKLLERAARGDQAAATELFGRYRKKLERMVELRMDRRMRGRVGASDVLQEAYLEATSKLGKYIENPSVPFFIWLRFIAGQTLTHLHQFHLGTKKRDARREVRLEEAADPEATSEMLAASLIGTVTTPSKALEKAELRLRLQEALARLEPMDRDVLALRHFEHLTVVEISHVLGIKPPAASKRYMRAAMRLRDILKAMKIEWGEATGAPRDG